MSQRRRSRTTRIASTASGAVLALTLSASRDARAAPLAKELREFIADKAKSLEPKLIAWRRDFHQHPELGNAETRTAGIVAEHLRALGLSVRTGVARTGVVAVLEGAARTPVVALRADMDALPVKEAVDVPFASEARGTYRGQDVAVAHACGHDGHTAILLTVAEILAAVREKLPGTVVFYFQPAEEGPGDFVPDGKNTWGARMMIHEGAMRSPRPDAVFGLHLWAKLRAGEIAYRPGPTLAGSDDLRVSVFGKQTHAASPWDGVDPIVASAHAILGVQTVMSRRVNHAASPTVVSIGTIRGGTRYNIIPDRIDMEGTIRTYDPLVRRATHEDVRRAIERSVEAMGARAAVTILEKYAVTVNDVGLTVRSVPSLEWAARHPVIEAPLANGSEDFSFMAQEAPGFFFFLGATERAKDPAKAAPNHSPEFEIDEATLSVGVRALSALATDFLVTESAARSAPRAR